jgi:AhpD family alkylhydroperoxidase
MTALDRNDLQYLSQLGDNAIPEAQGFHRLHDAAERGDGAIPEKYRQLAMLAVALTTQCPLCIENHSAKARNAGASRQEVSEIVYVTAAVRAGGAVAHGLLALRCYDNSEPIT